MFQLLLFTCNSIFFIKSGYLNLNGTFETKDDYINYYKRKCVGFLLPFVIAVLAIAVIDSYLYPAGLLEGSKSEEINIGSIFFYAYRIIWGYRENNEHLWYVYQLIPMLLVAPFLSTMLRNTKKAGLLALMAVAFLWQNITMFFVDIPPISYSAYLKTFINGYFVYFILGYYFRNNVFTDTIKKNIKIWILVAIYAFVFTAIQWAYLGGFDYILSITWVIYISVSWIIMKDYLIIRPRIIQKVLAFLAKYAFLSYLLHVKVYQIMIQYMGWITVKPIILQIIIVFTATTIVSAALSFCIIKPAQRITRKLLKMG